MGYRVDFQMKLETILGSTNVYFQPPSSISMKYPCIVYKLDDLDNKFADNVVYLTKRRYQVTLIDSNPDSLMIGTLNRRVCMHLDIHMPTAAGAASNKVKATGCERWSTFPNDTPKLRNGNRKCATIRSARITPF